MPDSLYPDLSTRDLHQYSVQRLLAGILDKTKQTGIEFEISDSIAKNMKRTGFFMPCSFLSRALPGGGIMPPPTYAPVAPYLASTTPALIGQEFAPGGFIAALRGKSRILQLGATVLPGLVGNVAIPRIGTGAAASWISPEGADIPEDEATAMDQVRMTPKTVAGYAQATRQFIASISPEAEAFLLRDLARGVGQAIDIAAISGSGANGEPLGILGTTGIGSVALGTNGGPITLAALEALEETVTAANVDPDDGLAYLTTPQIVKEMRALVDSANRPVWSYFPDPTGKPGRAPGALNGLPVARSANVPSGLTKGTGTGLSAILFGNWQDLLIGEWGVIELATNVYGPTYASGGVELRVMATVDIAPRHPQSFAAITDAT